MSVRRLSALVAVLVAIAIGCVFVALQIIPSNEASDNAKGLAVSAVDSGESVEADPEIEIIESGFGESDGSVWAIVRARAAGEQVAGKFVTATVNFYDEADNILATEEHVEILSWADQEIILPVTHFKSDPQSGVVDHIEAYASLSEHGTGNPAQTPLPMLESVEIKEGFLGGYKTSFGLKNETGEEIKDLRIGVACYNERDDIIGGGYAFPTLLPADASIRIDSAVTTSGVPEKCVASVNH